jgi:hypothetical protein
MGSSCGPDVKGQAAWCVITHTHMFSICSPLPPSSPPSGINNATPTFQKDLARELASPSSRTGTGTCTLVRQCCPGHEGAHMGASLSSPHAPPALQQPSGCFEDAAPVLQKQAGSAPGSAGGLLPGLVAGLQRLTPLHLAARQGDAAGESLFSQ